ncbi:hypothetical protein MLD38_000610 [Melastoma candidum]|uniref:Uncharacterized protein n=1 Tax=Melastoma candidum TaxID=119954 RepID=A0ACB9SC85_9MYRT|nr:hypothetical protein MLD38_000610 [Melastoma candidum]
MAIRSVFPRNQTLISYFARSLCTTARSHHSSPAALSPPSLVLRRSLLRPLSASFSPVRVPSVGAPRRCLSTRTTSSSLRDPSPNWSNRPPKETILLDGCDFEHWLVVVEKPEGDLTRDEIIDYYIKTLAKVVGSEEEARMKIYSVSHRCYYAFGALVPEEVSHKIKELPNVRWVLPDSYLDVKNKDYGGEPFINGQAVPYDPKYHEEWIRNHNRAMERNKRNDRPRNFDRSRNFERRRENREFQNQPMQNSMSNAPPQGSQGGLPPNNMGPTNTGLQGGMPPNPLGGMPPNPQAGMPPNPQAGMPPNPQSGNSHTGMHQNLHGMQQNYPGRVPPSNFNGMPPNNQHMMPLGGSPNNGRGIQPPNSIGNMPPPPPQQNYMGGFPQNSYGGLPPQGGGFGQQTGGGYQSNPGWANTSPQRDSVNYTPTRDPSPLPSGYNNY